jgi:hypothetical protein
MGEVNTCALAWETDNQFKKILFLFLETYTNFVTFNKTVFHEIFRDKIFRRSGRVHFAT